MRVELNHPRSHFFDSIMEVVLRSQVEDDSTLTRFQVALCVLCCLCCYGLVAVTLRCGSLMARLGTKWLRWAPKLKEIIQVLLKKETNKAPGTSEAPLGQDSQRTGVANGRGSILSL